jgi:putative transposase
MSNEQVLARLQAQAVVRPRFGYRRLQILLDREELAVNHKQIYRIYRNARLKVRADRGNGSRARIGCDCRRERSLSFRA